MNTIGHYQIKGELKRGGMSTVYLAWDPETGRHVAIKTLPANFSHDSTSRTRFELEMQDTGTLEHPAIVPVHDFGEEHGHPYLVMSYMAGGSLAERLLAGPLSLEKTEQILTQIAPALDAAHERGVIHGDLKPSNILFDEDDNAFIADFGIAKLRESNPAFANTGISGTPDYMSPEQAHGDGPLDSHSDIYSLGVILYEMLSGRPPYRADAPLVVALMHLCDPVPHVGEVVANLPETVDPVIAQALAKEPEARYDTAGMLATAFTAAARPNSPPVPDYASAPGPSANHPTLPPGDDIRFRSRPTPVPPKRWTGVLAAALALAATALTVILLRFYHITPGERDPASGVAVAPTAPVSDSTSTPTPPALADAPNVTFNSFPATALAVNTPLPPPTDTLAPSATPSPTDTTTDTPTTRPTDTPQPTSTSPPTDTPQPTPTSAPTNTATAVLKLTPTPTSPPAATATPAPLITDFPPTVATAAPPSQSWILVANSASDFPGPGQNGLWSYHWSVGTNNFEWQDMRFDDNRWCYLSSNDWDLEICPEAIAFNPRGDVALQWKAGRGGTYRFEWDSPTLLFYNHTTFTGSQGPGTELPYSAIVENVIDWAQFFWLSRANTPYHIRVYRLQE